MKFFITTITCFFLTGCGGLILAATGNPAVNVNDPALVRIHTKVYADSHTGTTTYIGPTVYYEDNIFGNTYFLRGWGADKGIQVYVSTTFRDWVFLEEAWSNGIKFEVTVIDREVGSCSQYGCSVKETVGVNLSAADVIGFSIKEKGGLSLKVMGKRGSTVLYIPAAYFAGFRAAMLYPKG